MRKYKMKKNKFPQGWDETRVKKVLTHYEDQSEEEAFSEDAEAYKDRTQIFWEPNLVEKIGM
jgi:hypothetical protein